MFGQEKGGRKKIRKSRMKEKNKTNKKIRFKIKKLYIYI